MATANPSTMTITNNSGSDIVVQSILISANGGSYTWQASDLATLCTDINFRAAFISGVIALNINGYDFAMSSFGIIDLLDQIAAGAIG